MTAAARGPGKSRRPPPPGALTGPQVILETLFAVLALGSVVLFGLRQLPQPDEFDRLAEVLDGIVCALFLTKALWDLRRAPSKKAWVKWGWADLLASIPEIEWLRAFRGLRLLIVIRLFRSTTRSVSGLATLFDISRARSVAATVSSLIVVSLMVSSVLVLTLEAGRPGANIVTAEHALWWSISTMFGIEPDNFDGLRVVSTGGRLIALWLVIVAFGLLGSLAGLISSWIEGDDHGMEAAPERAPGQTPRSRPGARRPERGARSRPALGARPAGRQKRPRSLRQSGA